MIFFSIGFLSRDFSPFPFLPQSRDRSSFSSFFRVCNLLPARSQPGENLVRSIITLKNLYYGQDLQAIACGRRAWNRPARIPPARTSSFCDVSAGPQRALQRAQSRVSCIQRSWHKGEALPSRHHRWRRPIPSKGWVYTFDQDCRWEKSSEY